MLGAVNMVARAPHKIDGEQRNVRYRRGSKLNGIGRKCALLSSISARSLPGNATATNIKRGNRLIRILKHMKKTRRAYCTYDPMYLERGVLCHASNQPQPTVREDTSISDQRKRGERLVQHGKGGLYARQAVTWPFL